MNSSESKVVLVTGASSGIGEATARELLGRGHRVHAAARRLERMKPLEEAGAVVHRLDLTDEASIESLAAGILEDDGRVDWLVNNAGYGVYGSVEETPLEEARRQFEVNLFGLARLTQLAVPPMRERGAGRIVNISSMGGKVYTPLGAWYHASEHALEGWSDCLRIELAPFGIDVVLVEPGAVETEFCEVVLDPMRDRSENGPYSGLARRMERATRDTYASGRATPPARIAEVIAKALEARLPKTRYVCGHLARPVMIARRLLSDRMFDRVIRWFG